ncbi:MAG: hypothetical protein M1820_000724 [Bogoriella megaspora]|nr:MAG: hypothetical protein M1820_000724 [Bogoriella megaspora]
MPPTTPDTYPKHISNLAYSSKSSLNTLDIILPREYNRHDSSKIWIIYIHGGAWRSPTNTSLGVLPSLPFLFPSSTFPSSSQYSSQHIAGIASLNYRLSPHPDFPNPENDPARIARHPQHLDDICDALRWLAKEWGLRDGGFVVVGHSAGGCLGLQVCMGVGGKVNNGGDGDGNGDLDVALKIPMPVAVLSLEPITDIELLVENHREVPLYEEFTRAAFGEDRRIWREASPVCGNYEGWVRGGGKLVVLGMSKGDELVEWEQATGMKDVLLEQGWKDVEKDEEVSAKEVVLLELEGKHDEIWAEGRELARAVEFTLKRLVENGYLRRELGR